jgi:hypothetical protein
MKKFMTVVFAMFLAGSLAFAQDTGGDKAKQLNPQPLPPRKTPTATANADSGKKATKTSKTHKGGKTSKAPQPAASPAPTPSPAK